jgi:hypothetical protein
VDVHAIVNVHKQLDYTYNAGISWSNEDTPNLFVGTGIISRHWGGWATLTGNTFSGKFMPYGNFGISYRFRN